MIGPILPDRSLVAWRLIPLIGVVCAGCVAPLPLGPRAAFDNGLLGVTWNRGDAAILLTHPAAGRALAIPVGPSRLDFASGPVTGFEGPEARATVARTPRGETWRFAWPDKALAGSSARVRCRTAFELDRAASWLRKRVTVELRGAGSRELLKQVVVDTLDLKGHRPRQPFGGWQSYPVLCDAFFAGVEFPAAQATVNGETAELVCKPGLRLRAGQTVEVRPVVYGVAPPGASRQAFEAYIASLRPPSPPIHLQYNSWWSAPYPFTQQQMLDIIQAFRDYFYKPYGAYLDSYCLDMGWADSRSVWQIDAANFPQGFEPLARALGGMKARLALWISPSSVYQSPGGLSTAWAAEQGFETFKSAPSDVHRRVCLAGPRFARAYRDALAGHTRQYGIAHFKFDGYVPTCPDAGHGHEPGDLSAETMADGFIAACRAIRRENPDVWIEATCFGFTPSPWWLAHVNTVIGTFGDDAPRGRVPCPVYRESVTTSRDFYNLQGARDVLVPICAQEVLGIIHQTPEPLQNDAVVAVLRGHAFVPMYVNPRHMNDRRWRFLAGLTNWARQNAALLAHTRALPLGDWGNDARSRDWGKELPRDPYGYAHFHGGRGLLLLRNPWIRPRRVTLRLDESVGADRTLKDAAATCLYPVYGRLPGRCSYADALEVDLRPYETRLLAFGGDDDVPAHAPDARRVAATGIETHVEAARGAARLAFQAAGHSEGRQLWLLCEAPSLFQEPDCRIAANGQPVPVRTATSAGGWGVGPTAPEHWTWLMADLPAGRCDVQVEALAQEDVRFSAWLVAKEDLPDDPSTSGPLPPPEDRVLDAVEVLAPVELRVPGPTTQPNLAAARGAKATASSVWSPQYSPDKAIDGQADTRWNSAAGDVAGAWLAVDFGQPRTVSMIRFSEAAGGRITAYKVQAWDGRQWRDLASANKPAERTRVRCRFSPATASRIRLWVAAATAVPTIYEIEAY